MGAEAQVKWSRSLRALVKRLASFGLTDDQIADAIETSEATLKRYCAAELALGRAKALATIAGKLYVKAAAGDTACMIFYLKSRGGWRERVEVTGKDGGPVEVAHVREELDRRIARLAAARGAGLVPGGAN